MTTKLTRPIVRELINTSIKIKGGKKRPVIISVEPGPDGNDIISSYAKGSKNSKIYVDVKQVINLARIVTEKIPCGIYSDFYYKAIEGY